MFEFPLEHFKSLGRKISIDDLRKYKDGINIIYKNRNPLQNMLNSLMGTEDSYQLVIRRGNTVNARIKKYLMSVVFFYKNEFYLIDDVTFTPFTNRISLGKGANVKGRIVFKKCVINPEGSYNLMDKTHVRRRYSPTGPPFVVTLDLFPAIIGTTQTGGIYNNKYNGGYITSTSKGSKFPVPARLKISIVPTEGIPSVFLYDKPKLYKSELKLSISEGTSKMTVFIINSPRLLMSWESKGVLYFIVKEYVFNGITSKSLKFNALVLLAYITFLSDELESGGEIDRVSLKYPVRYLDAVIDRYTQYNFFLKRTITDSRKRVRADGLVWMNYPILQYISYIKDINIDKKHLNSTPSDGRLEIDADSIKLLGDFYTMNPLEYLFRYLSELTTDLCAIKANQVMNNVKEMINIYLLKISGQVRDVRESDDRDHWNNRRLETVDDKIIKRFKVEMNIVIKSLYSGTKLNFRDSFVKALSGMPINISKLSKRSYGGGSNNGSTNKSGYYVNQTLSNSVSVNFAVEITTERDPDLSTNLDARILHGSAIPMVDVGNTPSDKKTGGLVRHISCLSKITMAVDTLSELAKIKKVFKHDPSGSGVIFFNNITVGRFSDDIDKVVERILVAKSISIIDCDLSVYTSGSDIIIRSISGTLSRPCLNFKLLRRILKEIYTEETDIYHNIELFRTNSDIWANIRRWINKFMGLPDTDVENTKPLNCGVFEYVNIIDQNMRMYRKTIFLEIDDYLKNVDRRDFNEISSGYCEIGPEVMNSLTTLRSPIMNHNIATRTNYYATQEKHKLERSADVHPLAPENAYARISTIPLFRGYSHPAFGNQSFGFLGNVSSGSYHGQEQEDHYTMSMGSVFYCGYDYIKNHNIEYSMKKNTKKNNVPFSRPYEYTTSRMLEHGEWLAKNNITPKRYNMNSIPITMKPGNDLVHGDILVVLYKTNERVIGSGSEVFHGGSGTLTSLSIEKTSSRSAAHGFIRFTTREFIAGHPGQKLTTNQAQKATTAPPARNLKGYMIDENVLEADVSMSGENVGSRGTASLIIEGYLTPILLHVGLSVRFPGYAKLLSMKEMVSTFSWWKRVDTVVPLNPVNHGRQIYARTNNKEYPFMMQMFLMSQDGAKKGSLSPMNGIKNETSGDSIKGGEFGGLTIARMDTNAVISVTDPVSLIDTIYADPTAVSIRHILVCKRCDSKSYIIVNNRDRSFKIRCEMCSVVEHVLPGKKAKRFVKVRARNHVNNTDTLYAMVGINKTYKRASKR